MTKKSSLERVKVTQTGSSNGLVKKTQLATLKGLGLGKIGKKSILLNNDCTRGMIKKVAHLINVEVVE